jgi:hypothetical protein
MLMRGWMRNRKQRESSINPIKTRPLLQDNSSEERMKMRSAQRKVVQEKDKTPTKLMNSSSIGCVKYLSNFRVISLGIFHRTIALKK